MFYHFLDLGFVGAAVLASAACIPLFAVRWIFLRFRIVRSNPGAIPEVESGDRKFGFLSRKWEFCFSIAAAGLLAFFVALHRNSELERTLSQIDQAITEKQNQMGELGLDTLVGAVVAQSGGGDAQMALDLLRDGVQAIKTSVSLDDLEAAKKSVKSSLSAVSTTISVSLIGTLVCVLVGGILYYEALKQRRLALASTV